MYVVEINYHYSKMNELHIFDELKEANSFLFDKGFFYDSGDEEYDLWIYNQFTTAEVRKK
ncbi:hypothetical protein [Lysinibacillus sp. BPa_S21]|uniref:hypothetical protein n=1 Tax=Lysinibacillus sp. BPa_S21 TaxID=2932478 RepID=UPI0020138CE6|nr:hypothetical protein [Lysinibacillus sp. BPa_S21]MCL1696331.1 hypothetical protein [Lysinibacillus sp. BPa_S21]